uniref:alpha-galactosidase n=1 Tax=Ningiella ruwaisensis TaxID=2364274 RepID=UPI0010A00510|nr:alpha-galactosidase [Ningiella ruwaisensis]
MKNRNLLLGIFLLATLLVRDAVGKELISTPNDSAIEQCNGCEVTLADKHLLIANQHFAREYDWNNGQIIGRSITDKHTGERIVLNGTEPDLAFPGEIKRKGTLQYEWVSNDNIVPEHLLITVLSQVDALYIKRQCKLFPDVPSLPCQTSIKGTLSADMINVMDAQTPVISDRSVVEDPHKKAASADSLQIDQLRLDGKHWQAEAVAFTVATDYHDTLVEKTHAMVFRKPLSLKGNVLLLRDPVSQQRLFVSKSSPAQSDQLNYPGFDFQIDNSGVGVFGSGLFSNDIQVNEWTPMYSVSVGVGGKSELTQLLAFRQLMLSQRQWIADRDDMVLMNTWGDRSRDGRVNEAFILNELPLAAQLGVSHYQIDDGWQAGLSQNSSSPSGDRWSYWKDEDWQVHPTRFPSGLGAVVDKANGLGLNIGLWFNPSSANDYQYWERDANIIINLFDTYKITTFKIDGIEIPNLKAQQNLQKFFKKVLEATDNQVVFNLDVTAGRRGGFFYTNEFGNIFLENRYTDWANYYPYRTLRNLWMLSRYVPAQHLQIEFLNIWRNTDKYNTNDPLSPAQVPFDYTFATTLIAQPLAWFEASGLPDKAFAIGETINLYRAIQQDIHAGIILPIGEEPNGTNWTGFQSLNDNKGYLLIMREFNQQASAYINTWLSPGSKVKLNAVLGHKENVDGIQTVAENGDLLVNLPTPHSFTLYRYEVLTEE